MIKVKAFFPFTVSSAKILCKFHFHQSTFVSLDQLRKIEPISDDKFKEIIHSLRKVGMVTQFGAQEFLCRKSSQIRTAVTESANTFHPEYSNTCVFDGKESFLTKTSQQVAEASKNPIYKRDSGKQTKVLQRVSIYDMSQTWKCHEPLHLSKDDEEIMKTHLLLRDSFVSVQDECINAIIDENKSAASVQDKQLSNEKFKGRRSRLFLLNVDDDLSDNDHSDNDLETPSEHAGRSTRSKSILISIENIALLRDIDENENFSSLEHNFAENSGGTGSDSVSFRRLYSSDLLAPTSPSMSIIGNEERCKRRQSIVLNEIICHDAYD